MTDTDVSAPEVGADTSRRRYELEETGFKEVPKKWRKFYRHWGGPLDTLAPNEVICPVCKVVIRATQRTATGRQGVLHALHVAHGRGGRRERAARGRGDLLTDRSCTVAVTDTVVDVPREGDRRVQPRPTLPR